MELRKSFFLEEVKVPVGGCLEEEILINFGNHNL